MRNDTEDTKTAYAIASAVRVRSWLIFAIWSKYYTKMIDLQQIYSNLFAMWHSHQPVGCCNGLFGEIFGSTEP